MSQILEKRTFDSALYDIICTGILAPNETITSFVSVTADQGSMTFGTPATNSVPIAYPDGSTGAAGQVAQVQISAGTIPSTADNMGLGVPNLLCTVRVRFNTNLSSTQKEATVLILLIDQPR